MAPALSTRRIGDGVTLREALGGRWATHWLLWLAFFPGTMAIVLIRESATTYPEWWWPVLSGVIQHLAAGVVLIGGGHLARRHRPILPVATVLPKPYTTSLLLTTIRDVLDGGGAHEHDGQNGSSHPSEESP